MGETASFTKEGFPPYRISLSTFWNDYIMLTPKKLNKILMAVIPALIIITIMIMAQKDKSRNPLFSGRTTPSLQEISSPLPSPAPETASHYIILAEERINSGDYDKATELLAKAIKLDPKEYGVYILMGDMAADVGQYKDAETYYRQALSNPKYKMTANVKLGMMYRDMGKPDMAEKCLTNALTETADSEEEKRERAMACLELSRIESARGDFQKAGEYLDEAFLILPHMSYNNYYLGLWYLDLGKYDTAEKVIRKCFQDEDPGESVEPWELDYALAMVYAGKGEDEKSTEYLESAVKELTRYKLLKPANRLRKDKSFEKFKNTKQFKRINESLQREISGLEPLSTEK